MSVNGGGGSTPCPQQKLVFFKEKKMQNVLKRKIQIYILMTNVAQHFADMSAINNYF